MKAERGNGCGAGGGGLSRVSRTSKTKNLHPVKNREHLRVRTLDSLQAIYGAGVVPTHPFIDGMVELTMLREVEYTLE